jgi:hypothetical protein
MPPHAKRAGPERPATRRQAVAVAAAAQGCYGAAHAPAIPAMLTDPRPPAPRRPDPVALVWLGAIALAVLAYLIGPDRLVTHALDWASDLGAALDALARRFTTITLDVIRAVAIGCYGAFVALSLLLLRRGGPAFGGLILVTLVFVILVWGAEGDSPGATARWTGAFVVAAVAALGATRRLGRPIRPR